MRILVVEDETKIAESIKRGLQAEGLAVDIVHNGDDGLSYAQSDEYDAIILDRMMPGSIDGTEVIKQLRQLNIQTPVLFLTARGTVGDKIEGLNLGADDYLAKPFVFDELVARVKALLRRPQNGGTTQLTVGDLCLDQHTGKVSRNNRQIDLSKKEFSILSYLMVNSGQIISKNQLLDHIWDEESNVLPNTVEAFIGNLRQKIDKPFPNSPNLIQTKRGFGYKIEES